MNKIERMVSCMNIEDMSFKVSLEASQKYTGIENLTFVIGYYKDDNFITKVLFSYDPSQQYPIDIKVHNINAEFINSGNDTYVDKMFRKPLEDAIMQHVLSFDEEELQDALENAKVTKVDEAKWNHGYKKQLNEKMQHRKRKMLLEKKYYGYDSRNGKINISEIFLFVRDILTPMMIKFFNNEGMEAKKDEDMAKQKIGICINLKISGQTYRIFPTSQFPTLDTINISQSKMTSTTEDDEPCYIAFIRDRKLYIISNEKLQEVWNDPRICKISINSYKDAVGLRAASSKFKINWLIENANYSFDLDDEDYDYYVEKINNIDVEN